MIQTFEGIECKMIVIEDNEASNYYANYVRESWENAGFNVENFNAFTPKKLPKDIKLNFSKYSSAGKYVSKKIKKVITKTEKACWYSHYFLWEDCFFNNKPLLILEHDSLLIYPENLWFDDSYGIIFFDAAAMGSYILTPKFARELILSARNTNISCGPYAFIANFGGVVNERHKKFKIASNQVMSKRYGNTINHYEGIDSKQFIPHNFIIID